MNKKIAKLIATLTLEIENRLNIAIVSYHYSHKIRSFKVAYEIKKPLSIALTIAEAAQIYSLVRDTQKVDGDLAEVGVYMGGSAKIICKAKGNKTLHLFDTFEGLPEPSKKDANFFKGQYKSSLSSVQKYLADYTSIAFYKGMFPESTTESVKKCRFSFVHLDVDLYSSTRASLEFFYPRLNKGAVLISHDYGYSQGVTTAFQEFFNNKPEPIISLPERQCLIVKT